MLYTYFLSADWGSILCSHRKRQSPSQRTNVCRHKTNSISDSCLTTTVRHNRQKSCQMQTRLLQRACQPAFTVYMRACVYVCVAHLALPQTSVISVVITFHWENNSPGPVKLHISTSSNKVTSISKKATELTIVKRKCELKYETCSVGVCDIYRLR